MAPSPAGPTVAAVALLDQPDVRAALAERDKSIEDRDRRIEILEFQIRDTLPQLSLDDKQYYLGYLRDSWNEFAPAPELLGLLRRP